MKPGPRFPGNPPDFRGGPGFRQNGPDGRRFPPQRGGPPPPPFQGPPQGRRPPPFAPGGGRHPPPMMQHGRPMGNHPPPPGQTFGRGPPMQSWGPPRPPMGRGNIPPPPPSHAHPRGHFPPQSPMYPQHLPNQAQPPPSMPNRPPHPSHPNYPPNQSNIPPPPGGRAIPPPPFQGQGQAPPPTIHSGPAAMHNRPNVVQAPPPPPVNAGVTSYASTFVSSTPAPAHPPPVQQQAKAPVPTPKQIDDAWMEYTAPSGAKFYHNSILKESTFTKPAAYAKREQQNNTGDQPSQKRKWQEYKDPTTGMSYYSDGTTTTWQKPASMQSSTDTAATAATTPAESSGDTEPPRKKKKLSIQESAYSSKQEAIVAFKGLLLAKDVVPSQKWNEVVKNCSSDDRWSVFEEILSVGERRQAWAEYLTKRANDLKLEERQERNRTKDAYVSMLSELAPTMTNPAMGGLPPFSEVRSLLAKDDRFHAVADESTRESLFLEFCEELRKQEERKKRNKKREAQENFTAFLQEKEEAGILTFATTWDQFLTSLESTDKEDPRFQISPHLLESDRQVCFADFVIALQSAEDDKRRRIQDARRRAEQAQRESFVEALIDLAREGKIRPHTHWRDIEESVAAVDSFGPVQAQGRETPREVFEEFADDWDRRYRRDRTMLTRLRTSGNKPLPKHPKLSLEEYTHQILVAADNSVDLSREIRRIVNTNDPVSSLKVYFEEQQGQSNVAGSRFNRRVQNDDSSEDEGEIVEDGEIADEDEDTGELKSEEQNAAALVGATTEVENTPVESNLQQPDVDQSNADGDNEITI